MSRVVLFLSVLVTFAAGQPFRSVLLDTSRVLGPAADPVTCIAATGAGSSVLAAWCCDDIIKACRLGPSAEPLDSTGLVLCRPNAGCQGEVDVASTDGGFAMVWVARQPYGVVGAILTAAGHVERTFVVDTTWHQYESPRIARNGANWLVVYADTRDRGRVMYAHVSARGELLAPAHRIAPYGGRQSLLDVAEGASGCIVAYDHQADSALPQGVHISIVRHDGTLLDSTPTRVGPDADIGEVSVSHDGTYYVVSWTEGRPFQHLRAARVSELGVLQDSLPIEIPTERAARHLTSCAAPDTTLLVWESMDSVSSQIRGCRLDGRGRVVDSGGRALSEAGEPERVSYPAASRCGGSFAVLWSAAPRGIGWKGTRYAIARRLPITGNPASDSAVVSLAASYQHRSDVACDGRDFLAVWTEIRSGGDVRLSIQGTEFDASARATGPSFRVSSDSSFGAAVAHGEGCYLVAWLRLPPETGEDWLVQAARVRPGGLLLDTVPLDLGSTDGALAVDVANVDSVFLVVWSSIGRHDVLGRRVTSGGIVLDSAPRLLETAGARGINPQIAAVEGIFVTTRYDPVHYDLRALRVDIDGEILDTAEILLADDRTGSPDRCAPLAIGDSTILVVDGFRARAWLLSPSGVVCDSVTGLPSTLPGECQIRAVSFDGRNFVVVTGYVDRGGSTSGVEALRISPQPSLLDTLPIRVVELAVDSSWISEWALNPWSVTRDSAGRLAVVLHSYETARYSSSRVRAVCCPQISIATDPARRWMPPAGMRCTVARSTLTIPSSCTRAVLADAGGRVVAQLCTGGNSIGNLAQGVYFVLGETGSTQRRIVVLR